TGSTSKRSSSLISSTISSQASKQSSATSKRTTTSRPKRKSSTNVVSSQQSQATSKKKRLKWPLPTMLLSSKQLHSGCCQADPRLSAFSNSNSWQGHLPKHEKRCHDYNVRNLLFFGIFSFSC
ncbi:hypothetical protein S245_044959, partial [Arachis hypogaea]